MLPENVIIDFEGNEADLIASAKNIQKEMDRVSSKVKEAGVSNAAYSKAVSQAKAAQDQAAAAAKKLAAEQEAAKKKTKEAADASKKWGMSFTELSSVIGLATQALQKFKQAYDFAKQGAEIEFTAQKFDRLAKTIGTTGDALRDELMTATKGTLSEMDAMAMATDLVSLGLVKTEKDAVRLATVVSGLGMDMNQLVLTLANQTTMRFDQLGVAVTGFDEKVARLKETGMDANQAFTEAFLQQAEQQLNKVGNAADTNLGSFMKLEAQLEDLKNEAKLSAAAFAGPLVDSLATTVKETRELREALNEVNPELADNLTWQQLANPELRELAENHQQVAEAVKISSDRYDEMNTVLAANVEAAKLSEEQLKEMDNTNKQFLGVLGNVVTAQDTYYDGLAAVNQQLADGKITTEEHAAKVGELAADYKAASADIVMSIIEMKLAQDGWTDAELNAYLKIGQAQGKFTESQVNMAMGAIESAEQMVEAYTKLDEPIMHVGERAEDTAYDFGLMEMAGYELAESAYEAAGGVGAVKSQLNGLPPNLSSWEYYFNIITKGRVPNFAGLYANTTTTSASLEDLREDTGGGRDSGGPGYPGQAYMIGKGAQPEMFVPSTPGNFVPNADKLFDTSGIIAAIQGIPQLDEKRLARSLVNAMAGADWG